jgi:hypothetical protein
MAVTDSQFLDHANENSQEFSNRQIMLKGNVSPPVLAAPIGAFYKNQTNGDRYEKTSSPDDGWTLFGTDHDHSSLANSRPCDASLVSGDLVWESILTPGNVDKTINNIDKRRVIGLCIAKLSSTVARVMFLGERTGLSGLTVGMKVYCSPTGLVTSTVPATGYIQVLGDAISATEIDFSPSHMRVLRV